MLVYVPFNFSNAGRYLMKLIFYTQLVFLLPLQLKFHNKYQKKILLRLTLISLIKSKRQKAQPFLSITKNRPLPSASLVKGLILYFYAY